MDFETYALRKGMSGPIPRFRAELLDTHVRSGMRVLDVGSGDGIYLEYLSALTPRDLLVGTEISQTRADRVRGRGFECIKVDSCTLPFGGRRFDVVTLFEVIEHLHPADARKMLGEISRVLVDGGVLIGSTPNYPVKRLYDWVNALAVLARRAKRVFGRRAAVSSAPELVQGPDGVAQLGAAERLGALFADDPTHVFLLGFRSLHALLQDAGYEVSLYTTFGTQLQPARLRGYGRILSNKVAFVCRKGPRPAA